MTKFKGMIKPNPDRKPGDLVIYGLIPTDLPSLRDIGMAGGVGKAAAHALHGGHQMLKYAEHADVKAYIEDGRKHDADTFNTAITLDATTAQIDTIVEMAQTLGYVADKVVDPTYPWFVDVETARLMDCTCTVVWEMISEGKVLVLRKATTFGWLLGDKGTDPVFRALVGALKLAK